MSCTETWSAGREKPRISEKFPGKGTAGHVAELTLEIAHLPGESVLPAGLSLNAESSEGKELIAAQFRWPDALSKTQPVVARADEGGKTVTTVRIPLIPLPSNPGRVELTLPSFPVSVARASGRLEDLCTQPHTIVVEDALASNPEATLRPDPDARPQLEIWTAARDATFALLAALPLALLLVWIIRKFWPLLRRPPAPEKPLPPWEKALLALAAIDSEGLLERSDFETYLDRVSDTLREYLGNRYGFDGLESTTRETLRLLEQTQKFEFEREVRTILQRADLVNFARRLPERDECIEAMGQTRRIIQSTTPAPTLDPRATPGLHSAAVKR